MSKKKDLIKMCDRQKGSIGLLQKQKMGLSQRLTGKQVELAQAKRQIEIIAKHIHYPECWDTACYSTVAEAVCEITRCEPTQCTRSSLFCHNCDHWVPPKDHSDLSYCASHQRDMHRHDRCNRHQCRAEPAYPTFEQIQKNSERLFPPEPRPHSEEQEISLAEAASGVAKCFQQSTEGE